MRAPDGANVVKNMKKLMLLVDNKSEMSKLFVFALFKVKIM